MNGLDVDLKVGPLELQLGLLSDQVTNLAENISRLHERLAVLEDHIDLNASLIYNSAAGEVNVMDLGYPPAGFWWQVRGIQVMGSDILQTPAGVGWFIVQGNWPTAGNPSAVSVMDFTRAALPQSTFYARDTFVVLQNQHLFILITGGVNATEYTASCQANQFKQFVGGKP